MWITTTQAILPQVYAQDVDTNSSKIDQNIVVNDVKTQENNTTKEEPEASWVLLQSEFTSKTESWSLSWVEIVQWDISDKWDISESDVLWSEKENETKLTNDEIKLSNEKEINIGTISVTIPKDTIITKEDKDDNSNFVAADDFIVKEIKWAEKIDIINDLKAKGNKKETNINPDIKESVFALGDEKSHLKFSKLVQVEINTPGTRGTVTIKVKHEGDEIFGTKGVTTNPDATCSDGISSDENNFVNIIDEKAVFYICGASTFVITPSVWTANIVWPTSGAIVNTLPLFAGMWSNDGATITLALSGGATIGTTTVFTGGNWMIQPTSPFEAGNHTVCINGWACRTFTVSDYNNSDGAIDTTTFSGAWVIGSIRSIAIQPDGKIIIWGSFTLYNGVTVVNIARLNADSTLDNTFAIVTGANNTIYSIALQPDGKIIVWGQFSSYNGLPRGRVARLNADGTLDTMFATGAWATWGADVIYTIALQPDGKMVIWGTFSSYNGIARWRIARLNADGTLDTTYATGAGTFFATDKINSVVLQADGKVIVWGQFTSYNGASLSNIVRLNTDGTIDTTFGLNDASGIITSVALQPDGKIIIVGGFGTYNSVLRQRIARINTDWSLDMTFISTIPGLINNVTLQPDGKIIVWWFFNTVNSIARKNIARLNTDGSLDTGFAVWVWAQSFIYVSAVQPDGGVLIWGQFSSYNGTSRGKIARLYYIAPVVTLSGSASMTIAEGSIFVDDWATWTDNVDGSGFIASPFSGSVNTSLTWIYTLYYTYTDTTGNTGNIVTRTVTVTDQTPPVVTLSGSASMTIAEGSIFVDDWATWTDNVDGSGFIASPFSGSVNTSLTWIYTLYYTYTDTTGNTGNIVTRTVTVTDQTPPVVTLSGSTSMIITQFYTFIDLWATWTDNVDGSGVVLTPFSGNVNTSLIWTYTLMYTYTDAAGNTGNIVTRTVTVILPNGWGMRVWGWITWTNNTWTLSTRKDITWAITTWELIPEIIKIDNESLNTLNLAIAKCNSLENEDLQSYCFAYEIWSTTMPTFESALYDDLLTRAQFSKIISQFATKIMKQDINTNNKCDFSDLYDIDSKELQSFIIKSCQLGIMWVNGTNDEKIAFRPNDNVTRGEYVTVLSRMMYGMKYELPKNQVGKVPFFTYHMNKMIEDGIVNIRLPYDNAQRRVAFLTIFRLSSKLRRDNK